MSKPEGKPGILERADRLGRQAENTILAILLAAMLLIGGTQIVQRNFFDGGLAWADEALRILVLWLALLGAVAASRDDRHISIDLLSKLLPPRLYRGVAAVVDLFCTGVCLILAWNAWLFVAESREFGDQLLGGLPAWIFQLILPIAFLLIGYRYLLLSLRRLARVLFGWRRP